MIIKMNDNCENDSYSSINHNYYLQTETHLFSGFQFKEIDF